jgi:hypothetical protein
MAQGDLSGGEFIATGAAAGGVLVVAKSYDTAPTLTTAGGLEYQEPAGRTDEELECILSARDIVFQTPSSDDVIEDGFDSTSTGGGADANIYLGPYGAWEIVGVSADGINATHTAFYVDGEVTRQVSVGSGQMIVNYLGQVGRVNLDHQDYGQDDQENGIFARRVW